MKSRDWNYSIILILCLTLSFSVITSVLAESETFTVPPLNEVVRTVALAEGDSVSGSISVTGGSGNDINFYVTGASGNIVLQYDRVTHTDFSFSASNTGTYAMHFSNMFSILSSKNVMLDYSVSRAILGIPQETFYLLMIVAAIAIAIITAIVVLSRRKPAPQSS